MTSDVERPLARRITIVSGGQTGADRAALDFAIAADLPHGGWCPRGRRAEDGPIADKYRLRETPSDSYRQRTEWNVRDSDATAIFTLECEMRGGTKLTAEIAARLDKPLCVLCAERQTVEQAAAELVELINDQTVATLNVAGPRESQAPQISAWVGAVLSAALTP